jgi:hypothetical protein
MYGQYVHAKAAGLKSTLPGTESAPGAPAGSAYATAKY